MSKIQTIAVLFGGRSSEHEISLRSCIHILKNIPATYGIVPVGINRSGQFHSLSGQLNSQDFQNITPDDLSLIVAGKNPAQLAQKSKIQQSVFLPIPKNALQNLSTDFNLKVLNNNIDCIFPVLHGPNGEDGRLQALFELAEIPYVGCNLTASAVGMDKDIQKRLAHEAGIPIAKYAVCHIEEFEKNKSAILNDIAKNIGFPCFIKPNALGSAVGTGKAHNETELEEKLKQALMFDSKALIEELLVGTEVECGFLGTPISPRVTTPGEIATSNFYSYEEKYSSTSTAELFIPARLDAKRTKELQELALKTARTLGLQGFSRIDFWNLKNTNTFIFNEVNTCPGLTSISMFPKLWEYDGVSAKDWIQELIDSAFKEHTFRTRVEYGLGHS